jgi:pimeloyl-ACP methyl ester carboxylesterase
MGTTTANQDTSDLGIVLFSGAGLDNWVWEPFSRHWPVSLGYIDLPGRGRLASLSPESLSIDGYVSGVLPQLEAMTARKLVFVCHSVGAVLGLAVAGRLPDRVHGIIHVASVIPRPGASFCSSFPFPANLILPPMLNLLGTRPPEKVIRETLCRGLPSSLSDRVVAGFCPESKHLYLERVIYPSGVRNLGYVLTSQDTTIAPRVQRRTAERAGVNTVETLETGHLPMLQSPELLAGAIGRILADRT